MKFLIVSASFYEDIAAAMIAGAVKVLSDANSTHDIVHVPGALEIPSAIAMAASAGGYDGYIALGCVIRGETYHFEVVSNESARGLNALAIQQKLAIGNGIITVENEAQARKRADPSQLDKGGDAARAALRMAQIKKQFGLN